MSSQYTVGKPSLKRLISNRIRYRTHMRALSQAPPLDDSQSKILADLRRDGYAILPNFVEGSTLETLQAEFQACLDGLEFLDTPGAQNLAPARFDPAKHPPLEEVMLMGSEEIRRLGLSFEKSECRSYEQAIRDFAPGELSMRMIEKSDTYLSVWLDPYLLSIVSRYLGLVPLLSEGYVRRSFPSPVRIANNYWHRDCIYNDTHLLKMFIFLTDCDQENGAHDYISGSVTDKRKLDTLNGKRFYTDEEVESAYPTGSADRVVSVVPAGTVMIEDTRGLHRANVLKSGYRDLGYAVFQPMPKGRPGYYTLSRDSYDRLNAFQKMHVPAESVA